jgi:NADPH:quinone reductase-like Zn-dependent oxidoreductase
MRNYLQPLEDVHKLTPLLSSAHSQQGAHMPSPENKTVLVTGASSGIGEGTARVLAEHGASVVLGARRTDKLMSIASEIAGRGGSVGFGLSTSRTSMT